MKKKSPIDDHKYLLKSYYIVNEYLSDLQNKNYSLAEVVVYFCTVTEKIFKIKLYAKNPVLVFDFSKLKDNDQLSAISLKKEVNSETIKIRDTINRYNIIFKNKFSDEELQALLDVYNIRNELIHGYKNDEFVLADNENIIKKMGTIWEKISLEIVSFFGQDKIKSSKPKRKYSEEELENVLKEEVGKKIGQNTSVDSYFLNHTNDVIQLTGLTMYSDNLCPRCGTYNFSKCESSPEYGFRYRLGYLFNDSVADMYKCKNCNLELTKKEYDIAKKIKKL